jgi:hypothetical protein
VGSCTIANKYCCHVFLLHLVSAVSRTLPVPACLSLKDNNGCHSDVAPGSKGSGSKINKAASQAAAAQQQSAATSAQRASSANSAAAAAPASSSQYANLLEKAATQQTQAAAAAAATAAAAQSEEVRQRTTFGRTASILGNSLLISGLGIASFFGYYTLKYTPDEVAALVDAKSNSSAAPDQVKLPCHACFRVSQPVSGPTAGNPAGFALD